MEGDRSFTAALTERLEQRRKYTEHTLLPELKEQFTVFHASLQSLISIMARKTLIQEDPYKAEQKISDIEMPDDTEFPDNDLAGVVGVRLSTLDNVLEYTCNYYNFSLEALDFTELKKLADLVRYIAWDDLKANSPKPTTRAIANLMSRLKAGADSLATGILNSALTQLSDRCRSILDQLKSVRELQRENHKLELRLRVFPNIPDAQTLSADDPESIKRVREAFRDAAVRGPFIPELVNEVIAEDAEPGGKKLRDETLERLRVRAGADGRKQAKSVPIKQVLIDGVRALAAASRALEESLERLRANAAVIQGRQRGFGSRFRQWLDRLMKRPQQPAVYELEFMDEATGTRHTESVDLDGFLEKLHKKAQLYGSILSKTGSLWTKMEKASDDQLYKFLNRELGELHLIHRRAHAFDNYFKSKTTQDEKRRLRGIKIELTTIRNSIAKASQLKHEYSSRKDESEQLKKMGIEQQ